MKTNKYIVLFFFLNLCFRSYLVGSGAEPGALNPEEVQVLQNLANLLQQQAPVATIVVPINVFYPSSLGGINIPIPYFLQANTTINIQNRLHDLATVFHNLNIKTILKNACGYRLIPTADIIDTDPYIINLKAQKNLFLNFINGQTVFVNNSIDFLDQISNNQLINIISLIPPISLTQQVKNWLRDENQTTIDYNNFFKIFLKAIIKRSSKHAQAQIPDLIHQCVPKVIKIFGKNDEIKQNGISKLMFLTEALVESCVEIISTLAEKPTKDLLKKKLHNSVLSARELRKWQQKQQFNEELQELFNIFDNLPDDKYSNDDKIEMKDIFQKLVESPITYHTTYNPWKLFFAFSGTSFGILAISWLHKYGMPSFLKTLIQKADNLINRHANWKEKVEKEFYGKK